MPTWPAGAEHDVVDAEHVARDLLREGDEALADLDGGARDRGHAVLEPAARRRRVVEAARVHEVLDPDREPDTPPHAVAVCSAAGAAREGQLRRRSPAHRRGRGASAQVRMTSATGAAPRSTCPVMSESPV